MAPLSLLWRFSFVLLLIISSALHNTQAINGGSPSLRALNGWKILEVITEDDIWGNWEMPRDFDGMGAYILPSNDNILRFLINHETTGDATISEVNVDVARLKRILRRMINGAPGAGGVSFVRSARQAFNRFYPNQGETWTSTSQKGDITFNKFCSGQSYNPHTFGPNQGFVDHLYIAGEEEDDGRLMVLDSQNRRLYQLSGKVGHAPWIPGNGGMPFDSWENAALIDAGKDNKDRIALLLSSDGGSESLQLYIGLKSQNRNCKPTSNPNFLERNGLACGRWWYLTGSFPEWVGDTRAGSFSRLATNRLRSSKLEDIDTSPSDPTKVALTDENDGVFIFSFFLKFAENGVFDPTASSFTVKMVADRCSGCPLDDPDNVEWTDATTLGGINYPEGILFINEDNDDGAVVQMNPDGSNKKTIAKVTNNGASAGTYDISHLLGYMPASILATSSMGDKGSLSIMINPDAALLPGPRPTNRPSSTRPMTLSPIIQISQLVEQNNHINNHSSPIIQASPPDQDDYFINNSTLVVDMAWTSLMEVSISRKEPESEAKTAGSEDPETRRALVGLYEETPPAQHTNQQLWSKRSSAEMIGLMATAALLIAGILLWTFKSLNA